MPLSPLLQFLTTAPRDLKTTLQETFCVSPKARQYPAACGFNVCSKLLYVITFSVNWDLKFTLALRAINHMLCNRTVVLKPILEVWDILYHLSHLIQLISSSVETARPEVGVSDIGRHTKRAVLGVLHGEV